jgi:dUTP pyrophosphatase
MSVHYRLELLPTEQGALYYKSQIYEQNENAGIDLYLVKEFPFNFITNGLPTLLDLGTSARMVRINPDGTEEDVHYWLCPRSSIFKTGLMMANSQGVIDRSYRGTLKAPVWMISKAAFSQTISDTNTEGMRLFQIVAPDMGWIREVRVVEALPLTNRGEGGFGSTGR